MFSTYQRINGLSSLLSTCLLSLLAAIALSSLAIQSTRPAATGILEVVPLKVYKGQLENNHRDRKQEFAFYQFDYEADLTSLFDWNTKQLFLYLSVEYVNAKGVKNDVVIWDRIVRRKRDAKLKLNGAKNKYRMRDISKTFRAATPANFTLKYNLMPYVGLLTFGEAGRTPAAIPFLPAETAV